MGHVLPRVSGFGWTIVPRHLVRFEDVEDNVRALRVEHGGATPKRATESLDPTGPRLTLSAGTNAADFCDLTTSTASEILLVLTAQAGADHSTSTRSAPSFTLGTLPARRK